METWNREELYKEVWDQPLVKLAPQYGISAVALGKVCDKLQIPLPGRGYWIKKEFGKPVEQLPLPEAKNLPVVHHLKFPQPQEAVPTAPSALPSTAPELPTDTEWLRIVAFESRSIALNTNLKRRPLVKESERILKTAAADWRGILEPPAYGEPCLDLRVSKQSLERALDFINAVIVALETEGFPVSIEPGKHETGVKIFGHRVRFAIAEKARAVGRREIKEHSWTRTEFDYKPTEELEFRVGNYSYGQRFRDGKNSRLESQFSACVAALLREGRAAVMSAKLEEQRKIEAAAKEREKEELARQIGEEEKKVKDLEIWVTNWTSAQRTREFIAALEKVWAQEGHDLSPEAPKGQRILWMKQQADRLDPMLSSPPSILDRKGELGPRWQYP
jgi:hypothetical protein